jgi:parallel beta-helix repeat protein
MNSRSVVTGGAALLLAFLLFIAGIALVTAEQQQLSTSSNSATGTLDAAALPAVAQQWISYIEQAGDLCPQITAPLLAAQEEVESGFNPNAVSPAGAEGIAQFLPSTWPSWSQPAATTRPDTPFNAPDAILAEGRYMCALAAQMTDLAQSSGTAVVSLALAAYNAGSAAVIAAGGIPPNGQTPAYVQRVEALEASFTIVLTSGAAGPAGLGTPLTCPTGAVHVSPGEVPGIRANTNYCFATGTYGGFSISPDNGDGFYGGGRAIMQGAGAGTAFSTNNASDVVVDGFTITGYRPPGDYFQAPGAVEFLHGSNITVSNNTIEDDSGTAVSFSNSGVPCCNVRNGGVNDSTITHNVITNIGYSGTVISSGTDDTVSYNDVSHTDGNGADTENDVAAVGKFALVSGTKVIGNYVHDNTDTAIWFDVFDTDSTIEENTVTNNRVGIFYELSCAPAVISENTLTGNGWLDASAGSSAWGSAVRVSASGANTRPPCLGLGPMPGPEQIAVENNVFVHNWDDVVLFSGHGAGIPANSVLVTDNTISGTGGSTIIDASGGNDITGNNTNGAAPQPVLASSTGPSAFGLAVVEAAAAELGVPYSWGGGNDEGPSLGIAQGSNTVGFDCSGLVLYDVWKASGGTIQLPHSSEVQATLGQTVSKADIEPGDVIAFALDGDFDHIGIYVGNNEMIDAPHTDGVVRIDDLGSSYWQNVPWTIRSYG